MKTAAVLNERALSRYRHRQEQCIEPRIIESLADVASRREKDALLSVGNRGEFGSDAASFLFAHPPLEHDDVGGRKRAARRGERWGMARGPVVAPDSHPSSPVAAGGMRFRAPRQRATPTMTEGRAGVFRTSTSSNPLFASKRPNSSAVRSRPPVTASR